MLAAMREQDPDWVEIGRWVRAKRNRLGFNKKEAARRGRVSDSTWHKVEQGDGSSVRSDILVRMATALMEDPEEFLARAGRDFDEIDLPDIPPLPTRGSAFADVLESFPQLHRDDKRLLVEIFNRLLRT